MDCVNVLVVDDHPLVCSALEERLGAHPAINVVGCMHTGGEALDALAARPDHVDVALVDLSLPGDLSGPALIGRLCATAPNTSVVVLTASTDATAIVSSIDAGAIGFVSKQAEVDEIVECVLQAADGQPAFDRSTAGRVVPALREARRRDELTERERQVLISLAQDLSIAEIGAQLSLSPSTVRAHVASLLAKLGAEERPGAVAKAFRTGILH